METLILDILAQIRAEGVLDDKALGKFIRKHSNGLGPGDRPPAKKRLIPYYLKTKEDDPDKWLSWDIDEQLEKLFLETVRMKPGRTASGVATITVITKPWPCASDCIYCPNDLRMPKSYLSDEPACQRAEKNYFDPYLQVVSRLRALTHMGHPTDKIELIILGGTWSDYPETYQRWFIAELFRALNDGHDAEDEALSRRDLYRSHGLSNRPEELQEQVRPLQRQIDAGQLNYNQALSSLRNTHVEVHEVAQVQTATWSDVERQHTLNETASHRVVGLVVETRPDTITAESLTLLRALGCTKIQMGIQSLDERVLALNHRDITGEKIQEAFELLRLFGLKIHAHYMINLYGSSPAHDREDYRRFVTDKAYLPDEVKLYPCVLVEGTKLCELHSTGEWRPYEEDDLVDVLIDITLMTPPFIRISRMIRDISAHDIIAGNKKANLRQLVENRIEQGDEQIEEIRFREIRTDEPSIEELTLATVHYETTMSDEYFLQWVTPDNRIAGFLRLSLPHASYVEELEGPVPVRVGEAMIREVHVYGKTAEIDEVGSGAQHLGLGRRLISRACEIARDHGYQKMNVISAIGTREYYRKLRFTDNGLYQQMNLDTDG